LIKIINKIMFIIENHFGLFCIVKIFDLAIIIRAAIKILRIINVEDIVSIDEKDEIDRFIWFIWMRLIIEINVRINIEAIEIHQ